MSRRLSWPIFADLGQAQDAQNDGKMTELGAKMAQDGACLAILKRIGGSYLGHFGGSWGRSLQLVLSWGVLARSWAILGDLGLKLGPSWQQVGIKMPKMSQDRRTWEENWWLKAMRYARGGKGWWVLVAFGRASGGA